MIALNWSGNMKLDLLLKTHDGCIAKHSVNEKIDIFVNAIGSVQTENGLLVSYYKVENDSTYLWSIRNQEYIKINNPEAFNVKLIQSNRTYNK